MREKLLDLMKSEGLRSSQLAEMLEINPAGISHILAGRNKPGFDLLQKILRRFPRINPDWLLLDSDKMYREDAVSQSEVTAALPSHAKGNDLFATAVQRAADEKQIPKNATDESGNSAAHILSTKMAGTSNVKRIIVLYDDQTFESFTPTIR